MSERIHALAQELFGKSSVEECNLQELKDLAQQYPYFAPAQFLLLEKLKQENSPEYSAQLQKAVLLYHNPLEFEYFISSDRFYTEVIFDKDSNGEMEPVEHGSKVHDEIMHEDLAENEIIEEETITELPVAENNLLTGYHTEKFETGFEEVSFVPEISSENEQMTRENDVTPELPEEMERVEHGSKVHDEIIQEDSAENEIIEEETKTELPVAENSLLTGYHTEKFETDFEEGSFVPETSSENEQKTQENVVTPEPPEEKQQDAFIGEPSDVVEQPIVNQPIEASNSDKILRDQPEIELAFEPFHTVDYFASQGIKLSQEEVPKDKFGKQLKSFTEWLKTMKRLPATDITSNVDPSSEKKVVHLAEDSVHDPDVVTEVMAEVWQKQGNIQKAIEVYNKLSLLNPSKRAYFAAKIENLKHS